MREKRRTRLHALTELDTALPQEYGARPRLGIIGTTRSRVSLFMNLFRKLGFIEYNGGLTVHSSLLNVVLHDYANAVVHPRPCNWSSRSRTCLNFDCSSLSISFVIPRA